MHEVRILKPKKDGALKRVKVIKAKKLEQRWDDPKFTLLRKTPMRKPINTYDPEIDG